MLKGWNFLSAFMPNQRTEGFNTAQIALDSQIVSVIGSATQSDRNEFTQQLLQPVIDNIKQTKVTRYSSAMKELIGKRDTITNAFYYLQRTSDMINITTDMNTVATSQAVASDINSSLNKRQSEINEWSNSNKLDTLFFLQVLFLCLTFVSALYFMNYNGIISNYLLNLCLVLTAAVAVYVLISRARYTIVRRNNRYWNKLRYPKLDIPNTNTEGQCGTTTAAPAPTQVKRRQKVCTYKDVVANTAGGNEEILGTATNQYD
jgi:hypothetical protein